MAKCALTFSALSSNTFINLQTSLFNKIFTGIGTSLKKLVLWHLLIHDTFSKCIFQPRTQDKIVERNKQAKKEESESEIVKVIT